MSELKPCPFCGGEDLDVHVGAHFGRRHESVTITCNDCIGSIYGSTEERPVEKWNTRHVETCRIECNERSNNLRLYTLSCGHTVWTMGYVPGYCVTCGRKVEQ